MNLSHGDVHSDHYLILTRAGESSTDIIEVRALLCRNSHIAANLEYGLRARYPESDREFITLARTESIVLSATGSTTDASYAYCLTQTLYAKIVDLDENHESRPLWRSDRTY